MIMKEALQKAIEGGLKDTEYTVKSTMINAFLCKPEFWESLGGGLGWSKYATCIRCDRQDCDHVDGYRLKWLANWHRFIDHLAEGKDAESFFVELLKVTKE